MLMNTILENHSNSISNAQGWNIGRLERKDIASAADVLRDAFVTYPITHYMFEGLDDGPERFRVMFEYLVEARIVRNWPVCVARVEGEIAGVAVISEPGEEYSTPELDLLWDNACSVMGEQAMERFMRYADVCDDTVPSWPHHYLGILGVRPDYQGRGIGAALVEATKREAMRHPDSEGVCLNTEAEQNLAFYERCGLEILASCPVDSIRTWSMVWRSR